MKFKRINTGKRKITLFIMVLVLVPAFLIGGGKTEQGKAQIDQRPTDTLIVAIQATPPGIDLDLTSGPQTWIVGAQVWETGLNFEQIPYPFEPLEFADPTKVPGFSFPDLDISKVKPGLIESFEMSSDNKVVTYNLRKGVYSYYGNELTSEDVLWTVERAIAIAGNGLFFYNFVGVADRNMWEAVDRYTVKITSPNPIPMAGVFNTHLFYKFIDSVEAKKHTSKDDPWATKWIAFNDASFGPYHITIWEPGSRIELEANKNYWQGEPQIKRIVFRVVPESGDRLALLKNGVIDIAEGLSPDELLSLKGVPNVLPVSWRGVIMNYLVMNNDHPPFNNVKVRQAINCAIPREEIVRDIYGGLANPFQGPTPSIFPSAGFVERHEYDFNLDKAKRLLTEAGFGKGLKLELAYSAADSINEQIAIYLQSIFKEINIDLSLRKMPVTALQDYVWSGTATFAFWADAGFFPDSGFVSSACYLSPSGNFQNYGNPEYIKLVNEGKSITDISERVEFYSKVQDIIYHDSPIAWIVEPVNMLGVSKRVQGLATGLFPVYLIREMSLTN